MLLYYHGQLSWVARSCGAPYSQREIRYGCEQRSCQPSQMLHQVTYDVVATLIHPTNAWLASILLFRVIDNHVNHFSQDPTFDIANAHF
eukprot:scaffold24220_cov75-Skeletonema_dohrnii-CCMP3373.AAC.1